jgi:sugar (pentulose or hexulose) kinase
MSVPVIAIFDIGKTNKKLFLFDERYKIVFEKSVQFKEITDDDGDSCEDVDSLQRFIFESLQSILDAKEFRVRAVNFCSYGASFVHINAQGKNIGPLYNYLKPFPASLQKKFYDRYGGESLFSFQTASPVLGSLNSGMQLYRLKYQKPEFFQQISYALHLPQFLSYLISGKVFSEITSVGCHTNLWDFRNSDYHYWVKEEGIFEKLPPLVPSDMVVQPASSECNYVVGIGLHDSSAALIPYLISFKDPFVLISTGTWAISLNPFNTSPLTKDELECDCLCYLQYRGAPVKASRIFAGHFHDVEVERIASHFNQKADRYLRLELNPDRFSKIDTQSVVGKDPKSVLKELPFSRRELSDFPDDESAYYQLLYDLVVQQYASTQLVIKGTTVKRIYVDGGFGNNAIYMNLLAGLFPDVEVYASSIPQATAIGTALSIHDSWNGGQLPNDIIVLKRYAAIRNLRS